MPYFRGLFSNIRFYILLLSAVLSVGIYVFVQQTVLEEPLRVLSLVRIYALVAITYLYLALLAGPLCFVFPHVPLRSHYLKARRAFGVSAFYFSLLHATLAFFGVIGGFGVLPFLDIKWFIAITFSFIALIILFCMAATSFDAVIKKLTFKKWKVLHRLVYIAGVLILIHATLIGSNFAKLWSPIPIVLYTAVAFLIVLHIVGLRRKYSS